MTSVTVSITVRAHALRPEKVAGYFLTGTLATFGAGRFSSAWLMRYPPLTALLGAYAVTNVVLIAFGILHPGWAGLWALFATGFFMSLMFPTIFAPGLKGLGPNTKMVGPLIVMAIVRGAILTPAMGLIAEARYRIAPAYAVPVVGYVVIAAYAFSGAKARNRNTSVENPVRS